MESDLGYGVYHPAVLGLLGCVIVGVLIGLSIMLFGCGYEPYTSSSYYGSSSYRGSSCESMCDSHCNTCWSWASDIIICERDCTTLCRQRGCDYISVPSSTCDETFQSVCM